VHVKNIRAAAAFVKIIHVLCDQNDLSREIALESGQRFMRGVWLHRFQPSATQIVETMNQHGIAREAFWSSDVFDPMPFPKAVRTAKGSHTGFSGNAGASENDDGRRF
jgi:hypothetical protein